MTEKCFQADRANRHSLATGLVPLNEQASLEHQVPTVTESFYKPHQRKLLVRRGLDGRLHLKLNNHERLVNSCIPNGRQLEKFQTIYITFG